MDFNKIYDDFAAEARREHPGDMIRKKGMVRLLCANGPKCNEKELAQIYEPCNDMGSLVTVLEQLQGHCSRKDTNIMERQKLISGFIRANKMYVEKYDITLSDFM